MKQYFAGNLKKLRKNADITQEKLAECLGVLPQTVSKWENGLSSPSAGQLIRLSKLLDGLLGRLSGRDEEVNATPKEEMIAAIMNRLYETIEILRNYDELCKNCTNKSSSK